MKSPKIVIIGGGSVQWTPTLVNDIALTRALREAELALYDIDAAALRRIMPACQRIVETHGTGLRIYPTVDRERALQDADFVVLSVGIGGLEAARNDLEIPARYGTYQSVGDTAGPGGLARALRHIPFAVALAREMEQLCPQAWLLNLTNPMTTICRSITKATSIRTIGLCHEVDGFHTQMANLFQVPMDAVQFEVAGINHFPAIIRLNIGGKDGFARLRAWLDEHDPFTFVDIHPVESPFEVFQDFLAVKLSLFAERGTLFGAGDRHVVEFLPGMLTAETQFGERYGVRLTTAEHREGMLRQRLEDLPQYSPPSQRSSEQLAGVMEALLGGPAGQYVINVPNQGQIDSLPRGAVVECTATVDILGVHPWASGSLSRELQALIEPHVERQETIVAAALSGNRDLARTALRTDPVIADPATVDAMFAALMEANDAILARMHKHSAGLEIAEIEAELAKLAIERGQATPSRSQSTGPMTPETEPPQQLTRRGLLQTVRGLLSPRRRGEAPTQPSGALSVDHTPLRDLMADERVRAYLETQFPGMANHPQIHLVMGMSLRSIARYVPTVVTQEKLQAIQTALDQWQNG